MSAGLSRIEVISVLFTVTLAALSAAAMVMYVVQLNRSHRRLRTKLEEQVAELRATERALRESDVFYHSLVESLPQSILRKDLHGRFTFCNRNFSSELGRAPSEVLGKDDYAFFPEEMAKKYRDDDAAVIEAGFPLETVEEHSTPNGKVSYVQVTKTPIRDSSGEIIGIQGIFWDVTERKQAEEQLHAQNLLLHEMAASERRGPRGAQGHPEPARAVGEAGRPGGRWSRGSPTRSTTRWPSSATTSPSSSATSCELLEILALYEQGEDSLALDASIPTSWPKRSATAAIRVDMDYTLSNLPRLLERTRDGLGRIQQIVQDLRVFARLDEGVLNEVEPERRAWARRSPSSRGTPRRSGSRSRRTSESLPAMTCFGAKLNQVVMNLVMNAIDACPEGGTVTIRTRAEEEGVRLDVIDTGCGIDPVIRERIFDPFFTTKPVGVGHGPGPVDQLRDRPGPRRQDRGRFDPRPRRAIHGPTADAGSRSHPPPGLDGRKSTRP